MSKYQLDLSKSLRSFTDLKDWQNRLLYIGGAYFLMVFGWIIISVVFIIPVLGIFIGCILGVALFIFSIAFSFYIEGYRLELIAAVSKGQGMETVHFNTNFTERMVKGFWILSARQLYLLPIIILMILSFMPAFIGIISSPSTYMTSCSGVNPCSHTDSTATLLTITSSLLFYVTILVGIVYQAFVRYVIEPGMMIAYLKDGKFGSMFKLKEIWRFDKRNWENLLLYLAMTMLIGFVMSFVISIAGVLIFLCVGIFLLPVVLGFQLAYQLHFDSYVIGELARNDKSHS